MKVVSLSNVSFRSAQIRSLDETSDDSDEAEEMMDLEKSVITITE